MGLFDRLTASLKKAGENVAKSFQDGMRKTREAALSPFKGLFGRHRAIDASFYEELEEALIMADVGIDTVMRLMDTLRDDVRKEKIDDASMVPVLLKRRLLEWLNEKADDRELKVAQSGPTVYLFVGVNGVGKTTTIGKLARQLKDSGSSVILAAGDTFRAGAIEQLKVWGERAGCDVVAKESGSDPAAVVFDAIHKAKTEGIDFVLCDTAGRLQNKAHLMEELAKIRRVIQREIPDAPHEVLLVLDATTGQNALRQAETFKEVVDVSGLILTKLDGTAKGGIALAIHEHYHLPVKLVGLGEGLYDLQPFDAEAYVNALFPESPNASGLEEKRQEEARHVDAVVDEPNDRTDDAHRFDVSTEKPPTEDQPTEHQPTEDPSAEEQHTETIKVQDDHNASKKADKKADEDVQQEDVADEDEATREKTGKKKWFQWFRRHS